MNSMTLSLQLRPALSTDQHTTVILNLGSTNPFLGEQWRTPDIHWYLMFFWLLEQHLNWCLIKHLGSIKPLVLLCWSKDSWLTHNKDLHRCISYGRNFQESSSSGSWRGAYETGTTELSVFFLFPPPQVILMSLILIEKNLQLAKSSSLQPAYIPSFQETSRVSLLTTTFCSWPSSIYTCERWWESSLELKEVTPMKEEEQAREDLRKRPFYFI